ncbi:unnamed protein product [Adineta ricciae]|uniref:Uncharacterized protein n=1 Tax=Adineta ricciae TaxID=249248 RepID=A0A813R1X9_ADIRI|nr:unnamed protein product [Adineta ricciae]CAF0776321.1 unnamed protein product [Adineta ricciae]
MSSKDQAWFEFLVESPTKSVKDEAYDHDMINTMSPLTDDIDYMIIDSELNPIHSRKHHSDEKAALDMLMMAAIGNPLANFDHRSTSSPNQTTTQIKQQPFSPPPFHQLTNSFFNHHHHHLHQQQRSTPSPDHERISPRSNTHAESSSTPNLSVPPTLGAGR